ncbi:ASKHA domain-containing protein [Sedimentisphaera salicampi]|uniref:ASKHA domain-containing protein n=1 Tax=Sedimentisphaera salicampi TaxID=1941349 RepID=UPI000B9BA383|nr:ASKHA domain-containing protein [Sedimentisphaera salicampi]OXU15526.1 Na(+)-translocating NADH-quinone reductase subunit F [Sedimentisphaera salicampi]
MEDSLIQVKFLNHKHSVHINRGETVLDAAKKAGVYINSPCGGMGLCGKCRVLIKSGQTRITAEERKFLSPEELEKGFRLACKAVPEGDLAVQAEEKKTESKILSTGVLNGELKFQPALGVKDVKIPKLELGCEKSYSGLLEEKLPGASYDLSILRELADITASGEDSFRAVMVGSQILTLKRGQASQSLFAVCFDIGTTTIAGELVNLSTGESVDSVSAGNEQGGYGADVLSRINYSSQSSENLKDISDVIVSQIDELISRLCVRSGIEPETVYSLFVAGNTTMLQLFAGINCSNLGKIPFINVLGRGTLLKAKEVGLKNLFPEGDVYLMPVIGGFLGGDTTACIAAANLNSEKQKLQLLVDIGTNGEIVLNNYGEITAASTAAGPALEGAKISCGMRADTGAVDECSLDGGDINCGCIGSGEPEGICGSGLIDAIACMLEAGVINMMGHFTDKPESLPDGIQTRIQKKNGEMEFVLSDSGSKHVSITQRDIREFQLAAGAIRAGINILLKRSGLKFSQLDEVLLAGGFGAFLNVENACRAGLLPCESTGCVSRISSIGNAALAGVKRVLLDSSAKEKLEIDCREIKHVELSVDTDFQMEFSEAMLFPQIS